MRTKFSSLAKLQVEIKRPDESIVVDIQAPPYGWWGNLLQIYPEPVRYETKMNGKKVAERVEVPAPEAEVTRHWVRLTMLVTGKCLAGSGELEQVFPAEMPTERGMLDALADSVEAELVSANLRDAEVRQLTDACVDLVKKADLPSGDEARAAGNS